MVQDEKNKKSEKGFGSSEILYYALSRENHSMSKLLRIFADRLGGEDEGSADEFFKLLDILKREGLIVY